MALAVEDARIRPNEVVVPLLPCASADDTEAFFTALGFEVTYRQRKPYLYLAFQWSGFELHYGTGPATLDPEEENSGGCLVMVDAVAPYHAAFTAAMREAYGKVLAKGLPRITRFRPGASRFTLVDPSGNSIIFIQRDEPDIEYGGAKKLQGMAKALDNARIFREFKNDDLAAMRTLVSALRRHGDEAAAVDRGIVLATLIELSIPLDEPEKRAEWTAQLRELDLTDAERHRVAAELTHAEDLARWLEPD
jgi:hypothetical protein